MILLLVEIKNNLYLTDMEAEVEEVEGSTQVT